MSKQKASPKALKICGYTFICLAVMFGVAAANKARGGENLVKEYTVEGAQPRHVLFETMPSGDAQEAAAWYFKYMGLGQYELCNRLFPEDQSESLNFQQDQLNAQEGRYIESYVIHDFTTLDLESYEDQKGRYDSLAGRYGFEEYQVVQVHFTQKWTKEAADTSPQWGDGEYTRDFVVGKPEGIRKGWKIFELGMM